MKKGLKIVNKVNVGTNEGSSQNLRLVLTNSGRRGNIANSLLV